MAISDWRNRANGGGWGQANPRALQAARLAGGRTPTPVTTNTNANRGPQRQTAEDLEYYNPQGVAAQYRDAWLANVPMAQRRPQGYQAYMSGGLGLGPAAPVSPSGPGGGGRGGGGYGGGGGAAAPLMSQAMFDSMLQALGTRAPQLSLSQVDLPDFQGQDIAAFDPAMYDQLNANLAAAFGRDTEAINQGAAQTTQALGAYNANPYASAQAASPPPIQAQGGALQATTGGGGAENAAALQAVNAGAGANASAFNDLLQVLGANYNQSQNSRLSQVQQTAQSAQNQLGAQNLGLGSQIGMARNQGYQQWQQRDAERKYQNQMLSQQWQREEQMRNQDIYNQQEQGRWQQGNEMIQNRLGPLLQLLQGTQGAGINTDALTQMLAGWSQ